jgi:predicted dehydrogenase
MDRNYCGAQLFWGRPRRLETLLSLRKSSGRLPTIDRFCTDPGNYTWQYGAAHVAECLATGKKSLITPEHGLHVLEVMNACLESQRTGRRVKIESTFKWPIIA